jgi:hypothetical protein
MAKRYYDLMLAGGKIVTWTGCDPIAAAKDYVASHAGASVIATRLTQSPVMVLGRAQIID